MYIDKTVPPNNVEKMNPDLQSQNDSNSEYRKNLEIFKDLLRDHRILFSPFEHNDETLWRIVCRRDNNTVHNIPCSIVRFGEPFEVEAKNNYPAHRRIPIFCAGKEFSKRIKDFSFPIHSNATEYYHTIIHPGNQFSDYYRHILKGRYTEPFLVNRSFFIIRTRNGVDNFGKNSSIWEMVELVNNLDTDCRIIREYTLITQIREIETILSSPTEFGFSPNISRFENLLRNALEVKSKQLKEKTELFLPRKKKVDKVWRDQNDGFYEQDLKDELDYIRQNGGDWIDD